jgi:hypothetical protein
VRLGLTHDLDSLAPLNLTSAQKLSVLSANYQEATKSQAEVAHKRRCASMPEIEVTAAGVAKLRVKEGSLAASRQMAPGAGLEQMIQPRQRQAGES